MTNCILWANSPDEIYDDAYSAAAVSYSDVQGGWPGDGNIDADPLFVDPDNADYHLSLGSPCINGGSNYAPDLPEEDIEGNPRIQQCRVDMGAYESACAPATFEDCNENGEEDDCDIYYGTSEDYDLDSVPDECDPDCNGNGVPDACDIDCGIGNCATHPLGCADSEDCNENGMPDECDIADGTSADCNGNGVPDDCIELENDCNGNLVPDECDVADGTSDDYDLNGRPDECDRDCNGNDVPDACDIDCGTGNCADHPLGCGGSEDSNGNGFLDECEVYVDDDAPDDPGPGDPTVSDPLEDGSAAHPFDAIQEGIDAADNGGIVQVADGTYTGDGNGDLDFGGKTITVRSEDGPENCIIDCENDEVGFRFHSGETPDAVVEGFTVTNGDAGVWCHDSSPTIVNCTITNGDRGVLCEGASPAILDCTMAGNRYGIVGLSGGCPWVIGCTIRENTEGGVLTEGADIFIADCTITGNRGGGATCLYGEATITNCVISGNTASEGAGFFCYDNSPTLTNCAITGNHGTGFGGGLYCGPESCPTIANCTITGNTAEGGGGVFFRHDYTAIIANCILYGNAATYGAEIALSGSSYYEPTLTVTYCDVEGSEAAVYVEGDSTLIWGDGNMDVDPGFAFADDPHLVAGAACIDAGTNDPPGGLPSDDVDGNPRPLDGDGDGSAIADIGAYEFNPGAPSIACSPREFVFLAPEGGPNPDDQVLSIRNCGGGTLDWEVAELCTWLAADPSSGQSAGEIDEIVLSVDVSGLSHGTYVCEITISAAQAVNPPPVVTVTLYISSTLEVPAMYGTIQAAIDAAVPCDTVLVADGTYAGAGNKDLNFRGKPITVRSENGPDNCIIDCENDGRGFYFSHDETEASVVDGFTITNGYASSYGAGIRCSGSSPTVTNCTISGNTASDDGGGVYCYMSNPIITNCTIAGNTAARNGGGIFCRWSNPTIDGCAITSNSAEHNGGGLSCGSGSSPSINNCLIASNSAVEHGGGAYCGSGQTVFTSCTISGNTAAWGGGVWGADPNIVNCTITDNEADGGGGVSSWRNLTIANSILWRNAAPQGPEIAILHNVVPTTLTVLFSDVAGGEDAAYVEEGCTLIWGDGNIDADPLFADPSDADYHLSAGSPCIDAGCNCAVPWDLVDLDGDGVLLEYVPFDLDGEGRFFDDPATPDTGSGLPPIVDMGAYEFGGSDLPPCHGDLDGDRDVDLDDLAVLLAHYGIPEGATGSDGDMDCDGDVEISDLAELLGVYGTVCN